MASPAPIESASARRRALARQARDAFPPMGVYAIRILATGEVRVGASNNVPGAINRIRFELQHEGHRDKALQQAWTRLGPDGVRFEVLQVLTPRDDPAFDPAAELQLLLQLWTDELATGSGA